MNGYLVSIIGTVLLCAIITVIIPNGKTAGTVKGIAKLVCVLAIVAPILQFFRTGKLDWTNSQNSEENFSKTVIELDESFIQYYSESRVEAACRQLENSLKEEFGINAKISIFWEIDTQTVNKRYEWERIRITKIHVSIAEKTSEEVRNTVKEYLTKNYCSEVLLE